ncbi:MAG: envelope stress response membrane protein PspC [Xanthomonadales bacterium]|nr:envelope stress response membrane protein PspC [Xanthomonadales bacterium]NIN58281.1 envelope stress response membrane protein PspC [Xanthomonadales bacterium]NIN73626.1 envelope stress response membrane protein PspC [Xanthomonadales bacterium]NIO14411.1 envelope stress response membrane protein PspC [Xanthomonadales bacterium]NIP10674.1 envelope stress response membrane protein PspC [Xanthomonadales bacterium]
MSDAYQRRNPHRLYRETDQAMVAGVCAGIADYFGFNRRGMRLVTLLGAVFFLPFVLVSYVILAIIIPARPQTARLDAEQAQFWRGVSNAPADVFSSVKHRFRELDLRLQKMEAYVTSREFDFDRELDRAARPGAGSTE